MEVSKDLVIYGAGGAGRELAFSLSLEKDPSVAWNVIGFVDDTPNLQNTMINGLPVLGDMRWLIENGENVAICIVDSPSQKQQPFSRKVGNRERRRDKF